MLKKLSHIMIFSTQHEASVRWYCSHLGYEVDYNAPGEYASLYHDQLGRLAIHVADKKFDDQSAPIPYFECDNIHKTVEELKAKKIKVTEPQREGESPLFCHFYDLDGNIWGIEEH